MSQEGQLDQLVDEISRRVRARLAQGAATSTCASSEPALGESKKGGCKGGGSCVECRGCHVNRADDVRGFVKMGAARIGAGAGHDAPAADLAPLIDHTMLGADVTRDDLKKLCDEARRYGFATVCVNAANVRTCAALLEGCSTKPIAVVGFPLGACTPGAKAFETREAVRNGAQEIDMVINIGALKGRDYGYVLEDICAVVSAASGKPVKVIIETGLLSREQKIIACALAKVAGAAFVKTSTGTGKGGATVEDIALMREVVGDEMGVKASGGVRTEEDARKFVAAGADRLGASASVAIIMGGGKDKAKDKVKVTHAGGY